MPPFKFDFVPRLEVSMHLYVLIIFVTCITPIITVFALELSSRRAQAVQPKGCRKLGLRIRSNLADEFDEKYEQGTAPGKDKDGEEQWRVKSLWIYPVKSCKGVELHRGSMMDTGMKYDRQFSFAQRDTTVGASDQKDSKPQWKFLTQRRYPLMALIKTEIWIPDLSSPTYSAGAPDVQSGGVIVVTFPLRQPIKKGIIGRISATLMSSVPTRSFRVPILPTPTQIKARGYTKEKMTIWKDSPEALNMSLHVPPELQHFLGASAELGLFRIEPGKEREVFRCAPRKEEIGWQPITGFADAYPLHMLNLASVRHVSNQQPKGAPRLSALRFRPNILVTGPPAYAEDHWKKIRIGSSEYFVTCRTARCRLPNVDPETGEKHAAEPDRTLKSFRLIDEGAGKDACLGMQMVPAVGQEELIKVGDAIEVLETGKHCYINQ